MNQPKKGEQLPPLEDQVLSRMLAMPPHPKVTLKPKKAKKPPKK